MCVTCSFQHSKICEKQTPKSCVKPANQITAQQIEKVFSSFLRNMHQTVSEQTVAGLWACHLRLGYSDLNLRSS